MLRQIVKAGSTSGFSPLPAVVRYATAGNGDDRIYLSLKQVGRSPQFQ